MALVDFWPGASREKHVILLSFLCIENYYGITELTLAEILINKLLTLNRLETAHRSEAKSARRSFVSKIDF